MNDKDAPPGDPASQHHANVHQAAAHIWAVFQYAYGSESHHCCAWDVVVWGIE